MAGARIGIAAALFGALALPGAAQAATAQVVGNDVVVTAAAGEANGVTVVQPDFGVYDVRDSGAPLTAGAGCLQVTAASVRCTTEPSFENGIRLTLGDGDDRLRATVIGTVEANGGDGADDLRGTTDEVSHGALVRFDGGAASDRLSGSGDVVELDGGDGDDDLRSQASSFPYLSGAGGSDTIRAEGGGVIGGDLAYGHASAGEPDGADVIHAGDQGADVWGGPGDDVVFGGADGDQISGDAGSDRIVGGAGRDRLIGGLRQCRIALTGEPLDCVSRDDPAGADRIDAGSGADHVYAGLGDDKVDTGDLQAEEELDCGGGTDSLFADLLDDHGGTCEQVERCGPLDPIDALRDCAEAASEPTPPNRPV